MILANVLTTFKKYDYYVNICTIKQYRVNTMEFISYKMKWT